MRLPVIVASSLVLVSLTYRYYAKNKVPSGKEVFSWSFILIVLAILSRTSLQNIADMFCYVISLIIILNDGYDLVKDL